ncbi:uncharacterized protein LOC124293457 [Neodiprion lecontei]|uniref:Uncharacterized protein LOC124293457 n=1 Tax=Neodiprion lecontei TaxID=441921 RepID=A0ABM3FQK1_NEOLC|nr:uncharacterized protein LOC124293457 [Neodiprion lecontei]
MDCLKPPKCMNVGANLSENWRKFKQSCDIYMKVSGKTSIESEMKVAIFLNLIGEDAVELFNTFNLSDADKTNEHKVIEHFEAYCVPKKNVVFERFVFYKRDQQDGETFEQYLTDIKKLSKNCQFQNFTNQMIRDRIVLGISDLILQNRLLQIDDLDMEKAVDYCKAAEASKTKAKNLQVKSVQGMKPCKNKGDKKSKTSEGGKKTGQFNYGRWARRHGPRQGPAFRKKYTSCGMFNHFSVSCRLLNVRETQESEDIDIET